jgi:PAS domain S-box-containing protein
VNNPLKSDDRDHQNMLTQELAQMRQELRALRQENEQLKQQLNEQLNDQFNEKSTQPTESVQEAQDSAQAQAKLLQTVLDNIPQQIFWKDLNSKFLGCNTQWAKTLGVSSPELIIGKGDREIYQGETEDVIAYCEKDQAVINSGEIESYVEYKKHKNKWNLTTKVPLRDQDQNIIGVLGLLEDITIFKAAEQEFQEAKEQLEAVLNAVPGTISWLSADGTYLGINKYLADHLGIDPQDVKGKKFGFLDSNSEFVRFVQDFIKSDEQSLCQEIFLCDRYYLMAAEKYQQAQSAVIVGIDITEWRQAQDALRIAEENYRSIFENALEGIFQSTPTGQYLTVNPAMAKIYRYSSPSEMIQTVRDIRQEIYVDVQDYEKCHALLHQNGIVSGIEYESYRQDGSKVWIEESTRAVRDAKGNLLYYEGIVKDITERKQIESQLKYQLEQLQIEVDHKKRAADVAKIIHSQYFQDIKTMAEQLRFEDCDW